MTRKTQATQKENFSCPSEFTYPYPVLWAPTWSQVLPVCDIIPTVGAKGILWKVT